MLTVTGNQIYLTRGDTMFVTLSLVNQDGTAYTPSDGDTIYFRLKKFATYPNILIEKQINNMMLQLDTSDTQNLPFGDYRYEIEVITSNNYHFTAIADELFTIGKEIDNNG